MYIMRSLIVSHALMILWRRIKSLTIHFEWKFITMQHTVHKKSEDARTWTRMLHVNAARKWSKPRTVRGSTYIHGSQFTYMYELPSFSFHILKPLYCRHHWAGGGKCWHWEVSLLQRHKSILLGPQKLSLLERCMYFLWFENVAL